MCLFIYTANTVTVVTIERLVGEAGQEVFISAITFLQQVSNRQPAPCALHVKHQIGFIFDYQWILQVTSELNICKVCTSLHFQRSLKET